MIQSSRDELLRYQGVDIDPVNWGWLCDRGRFDFEAVNSDDRLGRPAGAHGEQGLAATSWSAALQTRGDLISDALAAGGPDRRRRPRWRPWHERGRLRLGAARPRRHRDAERDAQLGDGLPVGVLGLDRATIDEAAQRHHDRAARPGPQGGAAGPVPAPARRSGEAAQPHPRVHPEGPGLTRYAWQSSAYEPGTQAAPSATALADPEIADQLAKGDVVVVAGRANLAESPAATVDALRGAARRRARRQGAPGAAARQRRRRPRSSGCAPGASGLDVAGHPPGRGRGRDRLPRAARCRPARRLSRTPTSPVGRSPARGGSSPSTRSSPSRRTRADVVLAGRGVRREGGHDHQHRGPGHARVAQKVTADRHVPARLDDRRRARASRSAPTSAFDLGRRRHRRRSPPASPAFAGVTADALAATATACSLGRRPRPIPSTTATCRPYRSATATTTGSW